jgi:hypothetical protein
LCLKSSPLAGVARWVRRQERGQFLGRKGSADTSVRTSAKETNDS